MANLYSNVYSNVGTIPVSVVTTNSGKNSTILGLNLCNKTYNQVTVDCYVTWNSNNFYVFKDLVLDPTTTTVAIGDNQRLIIDTNQVLKVVTSANSSVDVIVSFAETYV